jgi:hypothetical protein
VATRRERVIVSLDDDYSGPMTRCVGATALLNAELDRLSGQAVMSSRFARTVERDMDGVAASTKKADSSINQLSGRLSLLGRFLAVFGPGAVPVGAVAVAGIAGIATQLGLAATGGLSLIVALQGVGDALKAVEAARLDPTAENLAKAEEAMAKLAPEAQEFVSRFQEIRPVIGDLQKAAARGWFPGLTEALDSLEKAAPRIERVLQAVSKAGGDAVAGGAESLASDRWRDFFDYVADEAPQAVTDLSKAIGSLGHGLAEVLMIMDPASDGLRGWLLDVTSAFDDWATNLDDGDVAGFFQYLSETGPKVASAAGAIANAILQIAEAAAPIGGPVLDALTAFANAIAAIADSPLGTPIMAAVTAMSALSLASRGVTAALSAVETKLAATGAQAGATGSRLAALNSIKFAGVLAALTLLDQAFEGVFDTRIKSSDLQRNLEGLTRGTVSDDLKRLADDVSIVTNSLNGVAEPLQEAIRLGGLLGDTPVDKAADNIEQVDQALAAMVESGNAAEANKIFFDLLEVIRQNGGSQRDAIDQFDAFATATANSADDAKKAAEANGELADSAEKLKTAYTDLNGVLTKQGAFDAYQASLDNLTKSVKENGKTLDANTEKGRENRAALNQIAESAVRFSENLEGADRTQFLRGAIRNFREAAEAAGGMDARARAVLQSLKALLGVNPKPKVDVQAGDSLTQLARIKAAIDAIRSKTVTIQTIRTSQGLGKRADVADAHNPADGGTIPRFGGRPIRSAAGSTVPDDGGGYRDYLLYMLAPLEEVISNRRGQADTFRPELKDINAGMSRAEVIERMLMRGLTTSPRGLASGGTAGKNRKGRNDDRRIDFLVTGDMEALWDQLDFKHLKKSLNALIGPLEKSKEKLEAETEARESLARELGEKVAGRFTSDLFGDTNAWSAGGSLQDAINQLMADTAAAQAYSANVSKLQSLGLDDAGALNALLSQADPATVANIAATATAEQIADYERTYQMRAQETTALNTQVQQAQLAALAGQQAITNAQLAQVNAQLGELNAIQKAMEKNGPGKTGDAAGKAVGKANNRGAGNASRHQTRSQLVL